MNDFNLYLQAGLRHVLDVQAYDHVLFLIVLSIFYSFKDWKKVLWLITAFTLGHTISLALSAYNVVHVKMAVIEFLIPLSIAITAIYNIIMAKKPPKSVVITAFFSLVFGLIHGFGFSSYFKILVDKSQDKLLPLIEFAIGIEFAQLIIVLSILFFSFIVLNIFNRTRRDWVLVISSIVIGIVIPMLIERKFW
ncbi:MAG: HupE/UreJ family protein [Flavobacteriaceae bacterium]|nr:HupE/UreJ family protein [Flavobacteriaceae bacterium]